MNPLLEAVTSVTKAPVKPTMSNVTMMEDWFVQSACGCATVARAYSVKNVFTDACLVRRQCARHAGTHVVDVKI